MSNLWPPNWRDKSPPPADVLEQYPDAFGKLVWDFVGNAGGFSGARLWRGQAPDGSCYCLRAWPAGKIDPGKLNFIHQLLDRARNGRGLTFVPSLFHTRAQSTWVQARGQHWEITEWLPGRADFRENPTGARLFAAIRALAELHSAWADFGPVAGPCPAIERRLRALADWSHLVASGWQPEWDVVASPEARAVGWRLWNSLQDAVGPIRGALLSWAKVPVPQQACICDIWHDHVLYSGEAVSGFVDFGQVKVDCVAVDLARLLGSMLPDQPWRRLGALYVYGQVRPLFNGAHELVDVLDRSGVVVGAMNWLRWIYEEHRSYSDWSLVARRMNELAGRLDSLKGLK